jgi:hypothetical protein
VLNERLSCDEMEGLSGEAGGTPAGWEYADDVKIRTGK